MRDTMPPAIIALDTFSCRICGVPILQDISLNIEAGEYVSIIGPNGAGKTTLLKCLQRILDTGTGGIQAAGRALHTYARKDLARLISYVPQADGAAPPFSVAEFIMMGRYPYLSPFSPPARHDKAVLSEVLELTGMAAFARRPLNTLSGGERQRVFIAAALAQEARILLLDEPATFLDPKHQAGIQALLSRINRAGVTIVAVTHDINMAALTSSRVLALKEGRMAFWGTPGQLMQAPVLQQIFDKDFLLTRHPQAKLNVILAEAPC